MFNNIWNMTKMSTKLLLRNKGFLFFVLVVPILATLLMNLKTINSDVEDENKENIVELTDMDSQIAYLTDYNMYSIKVYDASNSPITKALLENVYDAGMFKVFRIDSSKSSKSEIMDYAKAGALKDKIGAIVVIDDNFIDELMTSKVSDSIHVYSTSEDERYDMFYDTFVAIINKYAGYAANSKDADALLDTIDAADKNSLDINIATVKNSENNELTDVSYNDTNNFGYTLAIVTVAFVFSGIMILGTIIKEKQNLVFTRIMLSKASAGQYIASKFFIIIITVLIQTLIMSIAFLTLVKVDVGISLPQFMLTMFLMGLIFNSLSVCVGICFDSVLSATYMAFVIWVVTALLSGLYFDISTSNQWFKNIALLMPQRWALKAAQMLIHNNNMGYVVIISVTAAYLIVILVVGAIGMKLSKKE